MIALVLEAAAEEEIGAAAEWYEERGHAGLGVRFVGSVEAAFDEICRRPDSFATLLTERGIVVRRHFVKDFPYQVVFAVRRKDTERRIHVFAVAHLRREPHHWRKRVR